MEQETLIWLLSIAGVGGSIVTGVITKLVVVRRMYKMFTSNKENKFLDPYAKKFGKWVSRNLGDSALGEKVEDIFFDKAKYFLKVAHQWANKDDKKKKR